MKRLEKRTFTVKIEVPCVGETEEELNADGLYYLKELLQFDNYKIVKVLDN